MLNGRTIQCVGQHRTLYDIAAPNAIHSLQKPRPDCKKPDFQPLVDAYPG